MQNSDRRFKMKNLRTLVVFLCLFIASGSALADAKSEQEARVSYNFRYGLGSIYLNDFDTETNSILMNIEKMRQKAEILGLKNELKELAQATFQFKHKVKIYRENLLKECLEKTKKFLHNECNKDLNK